MKSYRPQINIQNIVFVKSEEEVTEVDIDTHIDTPTLRSSDLSKKKISSLQVERVLDEDEVFPEHEEILTEYAHQENSTYEARPLPIQPVSMLLRKYSINGKVKILRPIMEEADESKHYPQGEVSQEDHKQIFKTISVHMKKMKYGELHQQFISCEMLYNSLHY